MQNKGTEMQNSPSKLAWRPDCGPPVISPWRHVFITFRQRERERESQVTVYEHVLPLSVREFSRLYNFT